MTPARPPAARRALALYDAGPRAGRLHVRARWLTAPLTAVERAVPVRGRILDLGCGHGLLTFYLALSAPGRTVLGVDIDAEKIEQARAAAAALAPGEADVSFRTVEADHLPDGAFDAIVVADVLYLLGSPARRQLLDAAVDRLAPDGVLLLKETARTPRWKGALTVAQERVATRLGITAGEAVDFEDPSIFVSHLEGRGLRATIERLDRGYPHPHVLITARRAEERVP
jgi:2-polyprenyl-3-methyl-5-hydroxy-6-metoxy-1,4-benzoquinol methylase